MSRWWDPGKPIREKLIEASKRLPADTPNPQVDEKTDEYRLKHFSEFIEHDEYGLALGVLIYIADACSDAGMQVHEDFWRIAFETAEQMKMTEEMERCRERTKG